MCGKYRKGGSFYSPSDCLRQRGTEELTLSQADRLCQGSRVPMINMLDTHGEGKHETQTLTCQPLVLPKQFSASSLLPTLRSELHFFDSGNPIARLPSFGKGHVSTSTG
jgi:hypothetical protein